MKWLLKKLQIWTARHNLRILNDLIEEEQRNYDQYDARMREWYRQRATETAVLNRLERQTTTLDWTLAGSKWDSRSAVKLGD